MDLDVLRTALEAEPRFEVAGPPVDAAGLALGEGPLAVTAKGGRLYPVAARAGTLSAPAGWVYVGAPDAAADLVLTWPDRHSARRFANRQVLVLDQPRARVEGVAAGGPWSTTVDRALLLGVAVSGAEGRAPLRDEATGPGSQVLTRRLAELDRGIGLTRVAIEALFVDAGLLPRDQALGWLDVHTPDRWGAAPRDAASRDAQGWIAAARDPQGVWMEDGSCGGLVSVAQEVAAGVSVLTHADLPCQALPSFSQVRADAEVEVTAELASTLAVKGAATLEIAAREVARVAYVDVSFLSAATRDTARLGPITTADGARVDVPGHAPPREGGAIYGVYVVLPAPLAAGATTTLRLAYEDTWSFARPRVSGRGTRPLHLLPRLAGTPWDRPGPEALRIGVPATADIDVAINGAGRSWEAEGRRWREGVDAEGDRELVAALGKWETVREGAPTTTDPGQKQPAIEVNLFADDAAALRPTLGFARSVIHWLNQVLPPFPPDDLTVFASPDGWYGFTWIAPHGMVNLQKARAYDASFYEDLPHHSESVFAHELAHQYWGNAIAPARARDRWLSETFAELYSDLYARAAWGDAALALRQDRHRKRCEELPRGANVSLDAPGRASSTALYSCGPYLFERALLERVGFDTLLGALDTFARANADAPVDGEALIAAVQAATDVPLRDFFDTWVYGGWIPEVKATWWRSATEVGGTVTVDVPFGVYEVPIWVVHGGKGDRVWCRVVDGTGTWSLAMTDPGARVELDPKRMILTRARSMAQVKPPR